MHEARGVECRESFEGLHEQLRARARVRLCFVIASSNVVPMRGVTNK